jgi:hypothetical protein
LIEVIFGTMSGFSIAFGITPDRATLVQWASLVGCSYVVARGLSNMYEGKRIVDKQMDVKTAES